MIVVYFLDCGSERQLLQQRERREDSRCHKFCQHPNPMRVRFVYAALFLVANVLAWVTRESRVTFYQGQRLNGCHGDRDCLAADAVLLISFASFVCMYPLATYFYFDHFHSILSVEHAC